MSKTLGKPMPDDDVVNKEPEVLLIGYGWVGQFMGKYFTKADYVRSDGCIVSKGKLDDPPKFYDLGIISTPTPMNPETGRCDISIVEKCVEKWKSYCKYFLIKSTVEIGTTDYLVAKYGVRIAMSPEYVGETLGHPLTKPKRDLFQIIGGDEHTANKIAGFWQLVLNANAPIFLCTAKEAEIIKYCENYWIMRVVDYWNDVYTIAEVFKQSFDRIREGLVLDPRLNRTHSFVYPKNRGWSGKCLPKDMNALEYVMKIQGNELSTLTHLIRKNALKWRKGYKDKTKLMPSLSKSKIKHD